MNLAARTVPLAAGERLVFDVNRNLYRVAYYQAPRKDRPAQEQRYAVTHKRLGDALQIVFGEAGEGCRHDPLTVEAYIRATPWGRHLP